MNAKRINVGVTIYLRSGQQSIWENGIFQNCYFLAMLLRRSPIVESVLLVNGGDGSPAEASDFLEMAPAPVIDLETARETLDVVIELSAQLNPDWGRSFRARGGHIVGMRVANDYVIDIERMMFGLPHGMLVSATPYSAMWTMASFSRQCAGYYEATMRVPVSIMPHLWSPVLLEQSIKTSGAGTSFEYRPGRPRWRLAVVEPNICMVKTAHMPMLIADLAHRQDPNFIDCLRVFNSMQMKSDNQFVGFARSLDLVCEGRASFEPRLPIYEIMGKQADAIVAHQWENAQNYVYYEALYGGYPLIHNSDQLGACGYRYYDFDCSGGALSLRYAHSMHDACLRDYRSSARQFIERLDPQREENVAIYTSAIAKLYEDETLET
ncbi:DUF2827 domain-containing protein [Burkholderia ambifaria]|uniref:DUF2827 domain-containing protein n=1 Tax=Burkholderia ambifaria TaxID=152480 RepID=UPI001E43D1C7|nr:DUF2827 domain-containing protein [Burkholderia ambifaria]UEP23084.1 DUF2827 domain-containing protein [Burkholderia ambifaria]UEP39829.1 DUF2827 domain-containing protein [Burkholderia ambifaria]